MKDVVWNIEKILTSRAGVKLEFVQNLFDSIKKFAIWLIPRANSNNWLKNNSNSFDSNYWMEPIFINWIHLKFFNSIWKFAIRLIRKVKKCSNNSVKINFKFVRSNSICLHLDKVSSRHGKVFPLGLRSHIFLVACRPSSDHIFTYFPWQVLDTLFE